MPYSTLISLWCPGKNAAVSLCWGTYLPLGKHTPLYVMLNKRCSRNLSWRWDDASFSAKQHPSYGCQTGRAHLCKTSLKLEGWIMVLCGSCAFYMASSGQASLREQLSDNNGGGFVFSLPPTHLCTGSSTGEGRSVVKIPLSLELRYRFRIETLSMRDFLFQSL